MSQSNDVWFVRLPDGQVLRANSTEALRHHLETGRIPRDSWVRRSPDEEWTAVEWMPELAEAAPAAPARRPSPRAERASNESYSSERTPGRGRRTAARDDRLRLQVVGTRGMWEELTGALDSTLAPLKLRVAYVTGLLIIIGLVALRLITPELERPWPFLVSLGASLGFIIVAALGTCLLTHLTFAELSQGRSGRWADATRGLGLSLPNLTIAYLLIFGTVALAVWVLSQTATWLPPDSDPETLETLGGAATVLRLVLLVALGPLTLIALQVAAILVVEECSVARALGLWSQLIGEHGRRLYLYEGLATLLALAAGFPLLVPLTLVGPFFLADGPAASTGLWPVIVQVTLAILTALALARVIAYLVVANLFIYLNLRYERGGRG
jgi:hypothetical protein